MRLRLLAALVVAVPSARAAAPPNPMPPASVAASRLPNGLTVVTRVDNAAPLAAVDLWVAAGAADDGAGAAHALEHMVFKGGKGVPAGAVDAAMEAAGGVLYAETFADATHYWATVPAANLPDALSALARLMRPPDVRPDAWDTERRVMLEEIARSRSDPAAALRRDLNRAVFGPVAGAPAAGTPAALAALTPDAIRAFFTRWYRPDRMTLVVVGPVTDAAVRKAAASTLGALPAPELASPAVPEPATSRAPAARSAAATHRDGGRVEIGMAFAAPDGAAVDVLCTLLAARLGAETAGVADRVEVSHPWQRAGLVILAAGGPAAGESALRDAIRRVAAGAADGLSASSVAAAARRRQWSWWLAHERPADQAMALGLASVLGDAREATDAPRRLEDVGVDDVRAAARAIFASTPAGG